MKDNQSRSFLLVASVTVLLFFAFVLVGFLNFKSGKHEQIQGNDEVSRLQATDSYRDDLTGFVLSLPPSWQDIGYKISTTTATTGVITYDFSLSFRDDQGVQDGFGTSQIIAVPTIIDSAPYLWGGPMNSIEDGKVIGKNSRYTFISKQFSPEAWTACESDESFRAKNERLCREGSQLRNPERQQGVFTVIE